MSSFVFPCPSQTGAGTRGPGRNMTMLSDLKALRCIHVGCILFCSRQAFEVKHVEKELFGRSYIWRTTDAFVLAKSGVSLIVKPPHLLGLWKMGRMSIRVNQKLWPRMVGMHIFHLEWHYRYDLIVFIFVFKLLCVHFFPRHGYIS